MAKRLLLIGIDGSTFNIIGPFIKKGLLPNLKRLIEKGVSGELESTTPPVTIPAWPCFMTGKNPGKLGIYHLVSLTENYEKVPVNSTSVKGEFWTRIDAKTALISIPCTYPLKDNADFIVSGPMTPDKKVRFYYPKNLKENIPGLLKDYEIDIPAVVPGKKKHFFEKLMKMAESRFELLKYVLSKDYELVMCHFLSTDRMQHYYWGLDEVMLQALYVKIDSIIGKLCKIMEGKGNIIIMSDHGFGPTKKRFYVDKWLEDHGYLKYKGEKTLQPWGVKNFLDRFRISYFLRLLPDKIVRNLFLKAQNYSQIEIDRKRSKAFSMSAGQIYINDRERWNRGVIDGGEYEKVRAQIISKLEDLKDEDKKLKVDITVPEEVYTGEFAKWAPDIQVVIEEGLYQCVIGTGEKRLFRTMKKGKAWHRKEGIFIAYGPDMCENKKIVGAKIIDIAPTIMHMFGALIPSDMDGRVITELFNKKSGIAKRKPEYVSVKKDVRADLEGIDI